MGLYSGYSNSIRPVWWVLKFYWACMVGTQVLMGLYGGYQQSVRVCTRRTRFFTASLPLLDDGDIIKRGMKFLSRDAAELAVYELYEKKG